MTKLLIDRVLLEQALEALEMSRRFVYADNRPQCDDAITALRAALAQEPYCYIYEYDSAFGLHREFYPGPYNGKQKPDRTIPVYTTPPRREWKGLTEEERTVARAIETALREKNQ